ncbi:MAG: hypothetical protein ACLP7Q_06925 [Isosphaeraceae bacterium]
MIKQPGQWETCIRVWASLGIVCAIAGGSGGTAFAQVTTTAQLLRKSGPELDDLYRLGSAVAIPPGRVRGTAILAPGTGRNGLLALGTRAIWQGKVIDPGGSLAVNRFFGLPVVRAAVYQDHSWFDGGPALILDYSQTSRIYAHNRDEIRQIAPGLYLGLMYARTASQPTLRMYFVLQTMP